MCDGAPCGAVSTAVPPAPPTLSNPTHCSVHLEWNENELDMYDAPIGWFLVRYKEVDEHGDDLAVEGASTYRFPCGFSRCRC
jgi:hypothetical protein